MSPVSLSALRRRLRDALGRGPAAPTAHYGVGAGPHAAELLQDLRAAGAFGALTLRLEGEMPPRGLPALAALWPGPVSVEIPLERLGPDLAALRLEGVHLRVILPTLPEGIPDVEAFVPILRAVQGAGESRGAGRLEVGSRLDPRGILLLPRLILKLGRFRPDRFLIEGPPGPADGPTREALKAAAVEVSGLRKALIVGGTPVGDSGARAPGAIPTLWVGQGGGVWPWAGGAWGSAMGKLGAGVTVSPEALGVGHGRAPLFFEGHPGPETE